MRIYVVPGSNANWGVWVIW